MMQYHWNKFWLWLARQAIYRTTFIDFPCYGEAEQGVADCEEFNETCFGPATIDSLCPAPVDGNETVGECMNAGWCGCEKGMQIDPGYRPWAATKLGGTRKWKPEK